MAALMLHWEAITDQTRQVLATLGGMELVRPFYLAGGTALALRLGKRISQDLDLFADLERLEEDWRRAVVAELQRAYVLTVHQDSPMGLVLEVSGLAVGLYTYGYPLLASSDIVSGLPVAGLVDIGLMKLDAIAGRGLRKDFYDLYFIAEQLSLTQLFQASAEKFPYTRGFGMRVLKALVDFDIADRQEDPLLLAPVSWEEVKKFFMNEARRLGQAWFG